jgi:hypothetical protein
VAGCPRPAAGAVEVFRCKTLNQPTLSGRSPVLQRLFAIVALLSLAGAACAADKLEGIALKWKPTSTIGKGLALDLTDLVDRKIQVESFADARADKSGLIGENREKAVPKKVSTPDSVPDFVTGNVRQLLSKAGLNVVEAGGDAVIGGEIRAFFVEETDTYLGDVTLRVTVKDQSGKAVWTGISSGASKRFGRSYKADNYYETLSDALIEATQALLKNPGFLKALAGKP